MSPKRINPEDITVLGISIGNCPAYRFAAETGAKRLISVVPGSRLAESLWRSNATKKEVMEAKKRGFTFEDFQKELSPFDPIRYVPSLSGRVDVFLGRYDRMIPYALGKELADELERSAKARSGLDVMVHTSRFGDHSSTAYGFIRKFSKRRL